MNFDPQLSTKKQIRNLLAVLFAGVACAVLLTLFLLYSYGPTGYYPLKNALISPEVISQLGTNSRVKVDKIEFSYQNFDTKKRTTVPVKKETYAIFYSEVENDNSLIEVPADIMAVFNQLPASTLDLMIQKDNSSNQANQVFQEVQFLYQGDYYRLQLRDANALNNWIYFYHPNIYNKAFNIFQENES